LAAEIHLNDGSAFVVDESFGDVERAYQKALDIGGVLRIKNGRGKTHLVNPLQVSYIADLTPEGQTDQATAAR
jgi:hypothetical protein